MATTKGQENMHLNGTKFFWVIITLLIGLGTTVFWQFQDARTELAIVKHDVSIMQEQIKNMAPMIADLHSALKEGRIYDYSAWRYQLNVNSQVRVALHILPDDWPKPPAHLEAMP